MYQHEPLVAVIVYEWYIIYLFLPMNHIRSAVDRGVYGLQSSQAKAYTIGSCSFSDKHAALCSKEQQLVGSK